MDLRQLQKKRGMCFPPDLSRSRKGWLWLWLRLWLRQRHVWVSYVVITFIRCVRLPDGKVEVPNPRSLHAFNVEGFLCSLMLSCRKDRYAINTAQLSRCKEKAIEYWAIEKALRPQLHYPFTFFQQSTRSRTHIHSLFKNKLQEATQLKPWIP